MTGNTKLTIMRHTEVEFSPNRYLGRKDVPLSKIGIEHAQELAKKLKDERIDIIYSSALKRAMKTADIIAKQCGLSVRARVPELNEIDFGVIEGLTVEEMEKKYPGVMKKRLARIMDFRVPEGESYGDGARRAIPAIKRIAKENSGGNVLVVMHGTLMKVLMHKFTGKPLDDIYKITFDYGCRMVFETDSVRFTLKEFLHG